MRRIRRHLSFANVTSVIALCVALGTGGAWAAATIGPGDIKDNAVRSRHIDDHTIHGPDMAANAVGAAILANDTTGRALTGTDVTNDSLTGKDIEESTLSEVPSAMIGGLGRWTGTDYQDACDPSSDTFITCATTNLNLPASSRVLVIGQVGADSAGAMSAGYGRCHIATPSGALLNSEITLRVPGGVPVETDHAALLGITDVLPAGSHAFGVECNQFGGSILYRAAGVVAVAISPD